MSALVYGDSLTPLYLGDGSLNTTTSAYNNKIYRGNTPASNPNWTYNGNSNQPLSQNLPPVYLDHANRGSYTAQQFLAGTNTYTFNATNPTISGNRVVCVLIRWATITGVRTFQSFQIRLNGTFYSLSNAVSNNLIRTFVNLVSWYPSAGQPYKLDVPLNFYTGVSSCTGTYSFMDVNFILNSFVTMDAISYYANGNSNMYAGDYTDGHNIWSYSYSDYPITITR
jgi:hypothetical protein